MDLKQLKEWLDTTEGIWKSILALIVAFAIVCACVSRALEAVIGYFGMPRWATYAGGGLVVFVLAVMLWHSFRRFSGTSRLEQPDAFTLHPTDPSDLIGRADDLDGLLNCVKRNRLVLFHGESGCGKSALVSAGLTSELRRRGDNGLLPVVVGDWGDDWIRGPLSALLDALRYAVSEADLDRIGLSALPDLTADISRLVVDLNRAIDAINRVLCRRPLIILDQFDDYQARYGDSLIDQDGNWVSPTVLASSNSFWGLIKDGLKGGRLQLLVVVRSDMAAGLSCIRFCGDDQTATRRLPRVESEYLRQLLTSIAPPASNPVVISNPEGGWKELMDCVEHDLKRDGAILMQQVRTVLLGLRKLQRLTPKHYRAAGGLHGMEALAISSAIRRACEAAGGGSKERALVRAVLAALVVPGDENRPPKAKIESLSAISSVVGEEHTARAILRSLQNDDVVRPGDARGEMTWQLDHDYLAHAVLEDARQADRWAVILREGSARYHGADNWRRKWRTLLPISSFGRICWERALRRITFGNTAAYVRASAIKPAFLIALLTLFCTASYRWNEDRTLNSDALRLIDQLGGDSEIEAVAAIWMSGDSLRDRILTLITADNGRWERAVASRWPLAHAGLEATRVRQMAEIMRAHLRTASNQRAAVRAAIAYVAMAARMSEATDIKTVAADLKEALERHTDWMKSGPDGRDNYEYLLRLYVGVASLSDADDLRAAVELALESSGRRNRLRGADARHLCQGLRRRMSEADMKELARFFRNRAEQESKTEVIGFLAEAYAVVAIQLSDPAYIKDAVEFLHERLDRKGWAHTVDAYGRLIAWLHDPVSLRSAARIIRSRLESETESELAGSYWNAYMSIAPYLNDRDDLEAAASILPRWLGRPTLWVSDPSSIESWAKVYVTVVTRLHNRADLRIAAEFLKQQMKEMDSDYVAPLAYAYGEISTRLGRISDVKMLAESLRSSIESSTNPYDTAERLPMYGSVAAWLKDPADLRCAARVLEERMNQMGNLYALDAYGLVAVRLNEPDHVKELLESLRVELEKGSSNRYAVGLAREYARVYVRVASTYLERADVKERSAVIRDVLMLAGNPLVLDPALLLGTLRSVSNQDFGGHIGAAVRWAERTYSITESQLRPLPISDRFGTN